jgi:hypothetical protein
MTREEAIAKAESNWWKDATPYEIVKFQLFEDKLCMDFGDFHQAVEAVLSHGVWSHEFATPQHLKDEFTQKELEGEIP